MSPETLLQWADCWELGSIVEVLPLPEEYSNGKTAARCGDRTNGGRKHSGIDRSGARHGSEWSKGICMGSGLDGDRRLIAMPGGRRVNVNISNIKPAGDLVVEVVKRVGQQLRFQ